MKKNFQFDEATHSYTLDGKRMTGVTSMLGKVLAKPALIQWSANMAVEYVIEKWGTNGLTQAELFKVLLEAKTAHARIRDTAGDLGKSVHAEIEKYVKNCIEINKGGALAHYTGESSQCSTFVDWAMKNDVKFIASEAVFWNEDLFLAGTADLVMEIDGKRVIGDVKVKNRIYGREAFLQMAAYHLLSESMGNPKGESSVILRIDPKSAELEEIWSKNLTPDRDAFMNVLFLYRYLFN